MPRATNSSSTSRASSRGAPTPSGACCRSTSASFDARPCRRPRDDRRRPSRRRRLRQPFGLSDRSAAQVMAPVLTRERHADEVSRYHDPVRPRADGLGRRALAADPGQRRPQRPAGPPDPRDPAGPGGRDGRAAHRRRRGARLPSTSRGSGVSEVYFSESDFELVQLFAGQASIALRNADEHHAVSQRAETDALTGLGNHGAFQRDLARDRRSRSDEARRAPAVPGWRC